MNELTPLPQLVAEIKILSQQQAVNIIEIGKRLIEAKQQLSHGEWGPWVEQNVPYSQRWANQYMKVATEFANWNPSSNLNQKKIFALLSLPAGEVETFIAQPHEVNGQQKTVDEMTSRELAATIRALKDVEKAKAESDRLVQEQAHKLQKLSADVEQAKIAQKMMADMKKPDTVTIEKRIEVIPPDYHDLKKKVEKQTEDLMSLTRSNLVKMDRHKVREAASFLMRDVGKHVKGLELLIKQLPADEVMEEDIGLTCKILRDTADSLEGFAGIKKGGFDNERFVTLDA